MKRLFFAMMTAVIAMAALAAPHTGPWTKEQAWEWYNAQSWSPARQRSCWISSETKGTRE